MKLRRVVLFIFLIGCFSIHTLGKTMAAGQQQVKQKKVAVPDKALKNLTNRGDWRVWGNVYNQSKKGQAGLTVELYDKDLFFDDLLGTTKTNSSGKFTILYQERDFKELTESKPDLYIIVKNKKNKPIYSSKKQPRFSAGKTERFNIILKMKLFLKPKILKVKK